MNLECVLFYWHLYAALNGPAASTTTHATNKAACHSASPVIIANFHFLTLNYAERHARHTLLRLHLPLYTICFSIGWEVTRFQIFWEDIAHTMMMRAWHILFFSRIAGNYCRAPFRPRRTGHISFIYLYNWSHGRTYWDRRGRYAALWFFDAPASRLEYDLVAHGSLAINTFSMRFHRAGHYHSQPLLRPKWVTTLRFDISHTIRFCHSPDLLFISDSNHLLIIEFFRRLLSDLFLFLHISFRRQKNAKIHATRTRKAKEGDAGCHWYYSGCFRRGFLDCRTHIADFILEPVTEDIYWHAIM